MNSANQNPTHCHDSFEDRVDFLFRELELAIKWLRPSVFLAIYGTESVHIDAATELKKKLHMLGQHIHQVQINNKDVSEISSIVLANLDLERTVFFVDVFKWGGLQNGAPAHHAFDQCRDFFVKNRIRVVFWLTEEDANNLAHYAPDFWSFRHCSVEFIEPPELERISSELESVWVSSREFPDKRDELDSKIDQSIATLIDLSNDNQWLDQRHPS